MTTKPIYTLGRYQDPRNDNRYELVDCGEDWYEDRSVVVAMVQARNVPVLIEVQERWQREHDRYKALHHDQVALYEYGRRASHPGPFVFVPFVPNERPVDLYPHNEPYDVIEDTLHISNKEGTP